MHLVQTLDLPKCLNKDTCSVLEDMKYENPASYFKPVGLACMYSTHVKNELHKSERSCLLITHAKDFNYRLWCQRYPGLKEEVFCVESIAFRLNTAQSVSK